MNTLQQRMDDLAHTHHEPILKAVLAALTESNPFAWRKNDGRLTLDADAIARAVIRKKDWTVHDLLTPSSPNASPRASTLHLPPEAKDTMRKLLHQIYSKLVDHFNTLAQTRSLTSEELARTCVGDIQTVSPFGALASQIQKELINEFKAKRKRLTFARPAGSAESRQPLMRWHKLTLTIKVPPHIVQHIAEAVRIKLEGHLPSSEHDDLHERIAEQMASSESDFAKLARIITTETVGQLKREATLHYLSFLADQMDPQNAAQPYVRDLLRRLRLFEGYLRRPDKGDSDYLVSYKEQRMDIRTLFAQANAFEVLPVFPLVDGSIGETTNWDAGEQDTIEHTYVFGMKLKRNGKVTSFHNLSSFEYHLALLRREGRVTYEASELPPPDRLKSLMRLVQMAILYFVVFSEQGNQTYDPIAALEREVLPILRGASAGDPDGRDPVDSLFANIADHCQRQQANVTVLAKGLLAVVQRLTPATAYQRDVNISVRGGIVETSRSAILIEGHLLRQVFDPTRKEALAYLEVEAPQVSSQALFKLQARLAFEDVQCFDVAGTPETCTIHYDAKGLSLLPIFLPAALKPLSPEEVTSNLGKSPSPGLSILCHFDVKNARGQSVPAYHERPVQWFLYRYVFSLIAYLGVQLLASRGPKDLFISLARLHRASEDEGHKEDLEAFIAMLGKVLAQILSTDYLANSQGLQQSSDDFKKRNAAASLYSPLPKVFSIPPTFPMEVLPRLALVVVSSRESDNLSRGRDIYRQRSSTVYGEVVEMQRRDQTTVCVRRACTFSDTYSYQELYTSPDVILDQIHQLHQAGYQDIVYVAQAPYSSTLHVTRQDQQRAHLDPEGEGLYFLSTAIIKRCVQENPGLNIYPVFRDQYHAMKLAGGLGADTLYIQDLAELIRVVEDKSKQMVVFLNLFSGKVVGGGEAEKYNGVVSYATLLNIYENILDDRALRAALIHDNDGKNPLKNMLVLYLTLFHLSRYEVSRREIALKLNPYGNIIGDESVGAVASRQHVNPYVKFNFLAFLSEVRKAIKPIQGK